MVGFSVLLSVIVLAKFDIFITTSYKKIIL